MTAELPVIEIIIGLAAVAMFMISMSELVKLRKEHKALQAEFRAYKILHHTEYSKIHKFMEEQFTLNGKLVKAVEIALDIKEYKQQIPYFGIVGEA